MKRTYSLKIIQLNLNCKVAPSKSYCIPLGQDQAHGDFYLHKKLIVNITKEIIDMTKSRFNSQSLLVIDYTTNRGLSATEFITNKSLLVIKSIMIDFVLFAVV